MPISEQAPLPNDQQGIQTEEVAAADQKDMIDSLLSDYGLNQAKPVEGDADLVDEDEVAPDVPVGEKPDEIPAAQPEPVVKPTEEKLYTWKGQRYTAAQLVEQGILEDALTGAEQAPHYQRLYNELKGEVDQVKQQLPQQAQTQQPQVQQITPSMVLQRYAPEAVRMTQEGFIEEDFVDQFPSLASGLVMHRDMIYELRQAVAYMLQQFQASNASAYESSLRNQINGFMDEAALDETYAKLKEPDVRQAFWDYLININPEIPKISSKLIKDQFMAYNAAAILDAARSNSNTAKQERKRQKQVAGGETSGTRPPLKQQPTDTDANLIDSFLDGTWPTGG